MTRKRLILLFILGVALQVIAGIAGSHYDLGPPADVMDWGVGIVGVLGLIMWMGALFFLVESLPVRTRMKWKNILLGGAASIFGMVGATAILTPLLIFLFLCLTVPGAIDMDIMRPFLLFGSSLILLSLLFRSWMEK